MKKWMRIVSGVLIGVIVLFTGYAVLLCAGDKIEDVKEKKKAAEGMIVVEEPDRDENGDSGSADSKDFGDSDPYWELAKDMLLDMITENEYIELQFKEEAHELFSEEWYEHGRLTEPYLYVYQCAMYDRTKYTEGDLVEQDMTFFKIDSPRRAGEFPGKFYFCVWVKKTERGVEIGTDFSQKLFRHILWECSIECFEESGSYLIGLFPSEQWMMYCPLYELMGEDMVMVSDIPEEELEELFRDACERMHAWQEKVPGDLTQNVRFGEAFDTYAYKRYEQKLTEEDFENYSQYQQYYTWCDEQADIDSYWKWLGVCRGFYPEYRLDFHTGYDSEKQNIFHEMCGKREEYHAWLVKWEEGKEEKENGTGEQAAGSTDCVVEKGDSLWKIAERYYGNGREWQQIYEENREVIGEDENQIFPGQTLILH